MTMPGNILPHNPLNAKGLLDEVKKLKGDKGWFQWELECILAKHPGNKVLEVALAEATKEKPKAEKPPAPTPGETQAKPAPPKKTGKLTRAQRIKQAKKDKKKGPAKPGEKNASPPTPLAERTTKAYPSKGTAEPPEPSATEEEIALIDTPDKKPLVAPEVVASAEEEEEE